MAHAYSWWQQILWTNCSLTAVFSPSTTCCSNRDTAEVIISLSDTKSNLFQFSWIGLVGLQIHTSLDIDIIMQRTWNRSLLLMDILVQVEVLKILENVENTVFNLRILMSVQLPRFMYIAPIRLNWILNSSGIYWSNFKLYRKSKHGLGVNQWWNFEYDFHLGFVLIIHHEKLNRSS